MEAESYAVLYFMSFQLALPRRQDLAADDKPKIEDELSLCQNVAHSKSVQ